MKLTDREFAKVARVKMVEGLASLCDHGTGLPPEMEEIIAAKLGNLLCIARRNLFKDEDRDISRTDIIIALASASAESDRTYHLTDELEDAVPMAKTAMLVMESKIASSITNELFKEESNGNREDN